MVGISKKITLTLAIALLLFVSMNQAARTLPEDLSKTHFKGVGQGNPGNDEGCDGVGEEECLARRTLAAHTDYIYTQEKGN